MGSSSLRVISFIFIALLLTMPSMPLIVSDDVLLNASNGPYLFSSKNDTNVIISNETTISLSFNFEEPLISEKTIHSHAFTSVEIPDLKTLRMKDKPQLPMKSIQVLLPPNSAADTIDTHSDKKIFSLENYIIPNSDRLDDGFFNQFEFFQSELEFYENIDCYPANVFEVIDTQQYRGYSILLLNLYPIQYYPEQNEIIHSSTITLTIHVQPTQQDHSLYRNLQSDASLIKNQVENPSMTEIYTQDLYPTVDPANLDQYQYIIITDDDFEPYFTSFILYKQDYLTAKIVNLSYIYSSFTGQDNQEKIRAFIQYAYLNWATEYVLLGGDTKIIPYRGLWGHAIDHNGEILHDDHIPADIYYAGLDGSWDADEDNIFGEDNEHSIQDEADFFAEVYIGRAPVENAVEIGTFINKVITFETSNKPKRIQLHQSGINAQNIPDSSIIPEKCAQWIPQDYAIDKLYQVNELITPSTWMDCFQKDALIIQHTGNGVRDKYYLSWPTNTFTSSEATILENDFFPIHTSVACNSGAFDTNDSIAESILLNPYGGASACLFNSRKGFTSNTDAHAYSGEIIEQQFFQLFTKDVVHIGKVHQFAKEAYAADASRNNAYRWCYYSVNLLGDPEMPILDTREEYLNSNFLYVDDSYTSATSGWGETHFNTIQHAIDAAADWDTIYVKKGSYEGDLIIRKTINLVGEDAESTIIKGKGSTSTILIAGNRVKVSGFTIENKNFPQKSYRFLVSNSNYVSISDCIISDGSIGLYALASKNVFVINNIFQTNKEGIFADINTNNLYVSDNYFSIEFSEGYGVNLIADSKYIIENNTFISKENFYNFTYAIVADGTATIEANTIENCHIGIWAYDGVHHICGNHLKDNRYIGIYVSDSVFVIEGNMIQNNGNYFIKDETYGFNMKPGGIIIDGSGDDASEICYNAIMNNKGYGVYLDDHFSVQTNVIENDFVNNSINAFFKNSRCTWFNNYWGRNRMFPKIILGFYKNQIGLVLPMMQVDLFPSAMLINN